jgi:hypothetical protein
VFSDDVQPFPQTEHAENFFRKWSASSGFTLSVKTLALLQSSLLTYMFKHAFVASGELYLL